MISLLLVCVYGVWLAWCFACVYLACIRWVSSVVVWLCGDFNLCGCGLTGVASLDLLL